MTDFNCYVGNWPFYKLRRKSLEDLKKVHTENNILLGYVSSVESIFYNDFYESEKELFNEIKESGYKQVVTVNPTMPACALTLERCIEEFEVSGIRIVPGYHEYNINSEILKPVLELARKHKLPLFITARMIDERLTHIVHPKLLADEDLIKFINDNNDILIILCHFKLGEVKRIKDAIINNPNVFCDVSGFRVNIIGDNSINELLKKCVYGSAFPLCTVKSGVLLVDAEIEDAQIKKTIMSGESLLSKIKNY